MIRRISSAYIAITLLLSFSTIVAAQSNRDVKAEAPKVKTDSVIKQGEHDKDSAYTNSLGQKFVYIQPGTFMMGSPTSDFWRYSDEKLRHVTIENGFYLQTTEVTQKQWKSIMGKNPSNFNNCGDNCPVERVSWEDVQEFIKKLNLSEEGNKYRLPTEAEWEYACRAGNKERYSFGNSEDGLDEYAWYDGNSRKKPHPVAQKKPNAWGLYDIHGNVWEWCQNSHNDYPSGSVDFSTEKLQVFRGGSWSGGPRESRCATRPVSTPDGSDDDIGFRLLRIK